MNEVTKFRAADQRMAQLERELAAMTRERDDAETRLRIEKECRAANKYAVVDTVGGWVEGQPTTEFNYLQRLQELVDAELELKRTHAEVERLRELLRRGADVAYREVFSATADEGEQLCAGLDQWIADARVALGEEKP